MNKDITMTPHSLKVNGIHLHYVTWGQFSHPADRAVLLVHGLTNNHLTWSELGPRLAEHGWYLIAPDLRVDAAGAASHRMALASPTTSMTCSCSVTRSACNECISSVIRSER